MKKEDESGLGLKDKAERLKYMFDALNKQKKKYERLLNSRGLSKIEYEQYTEVTMKLNNFNERCKNFIRPRKNGVGKFSVEDYLSWCHEQTAMMDGDRLPPGVGDGMRIDSGGYQRDVLSEGLGGFPRGEAVDLPGGVPSYEKMGDEYFYGRKMPGGRHYDMRGVPRFEGQRSAPPFERGNCGYYGERGGEGQAGDGIDYGYRRDGAGMGAQFRRGPPDEMARMNATMEPLRRPGDAPFSPRSTEQLELSQLLSPEQIKQRRFDPSPRTGAGGFGHSPREPASPEQLENGQAQGRPPAPGLYGLPRAGQMHYMMPPQQGYYPFQRPPYFSDPRAGKLGYPVRGQQKAPFGPQGFYQGPPHYPPHYNFASSESHYGQRGPGVSYPTMSPHSQPSPLLSPFMHPGPRRNSRPENPADGMPYGFPGSPDCAGQDGSGFYDRRHVSMSPETPEYPTPDSSTSSKPMERQELASNYRPEFFDKLRSLNRQPFSEFLAEKDFALSEESRDCILIYLDSIMHRVMGASCRAAVSAGNGQLTLKEVSAAIADVNKRCEDGQRPLNRDRVGSQTGMLDLLENGADKDAAE